MPPVVYGTAWKKERTEELVLKAVLEGFRGIDTACQPKHYFEPGVGRALLRLQQQHNIPRSQLWVQTKFTPVRGQDPNNIPYDPNAPLEEQVVQSMTRSLANLHTDYVDALVLHSPLPTHEMASRAALLFVSLTLDVQTMRVWRAMENLCEEGKARSLGISNCYSLSALKDLHSSSRVKPTILQNRFYRDSNFDKELREFCTQHGITYQSFWTLTANPDILSSRAVKSLSNKYNKTPEQVLFAFVQAIGITPLTGTSSTGHMREDLDVAQSEGSELFLPSS
ncbi:hypothetical protein GUITHDRAFT_159498 [Guillardia theta CCMP2712]|uniref:NADP-dependent oxidoreductase domain-containing protein n=1 Tax=Guillardia theta (strain CCMP2712) TaxID=905079 RepID=L1JKJ2_GUITC|nr:hypothetical protein GUITHDRAFT_159498 [Guillardia theta CCMP2712]EKX48610.1 hypothetical protein GUITHDRAFT_159498 [Guillardia theta CCMP2712]|eukprot:XP_005835590.1 hypothetical protein GUITHDRAFT_159498 [Guillardia theta CCMP2712]